MVSIFILRKIVAEGGRLQLFSICCNFGQFFLQVLKNSGYDEKFRSEILNLGLKGFDKIMKAERDGVRSIF